MSKNPRGNDSALAGVETVNGDLFCMTYGSFVMQLLRDHQSTATVNAELYKIGFNIGLRLVEDFFAKSNITQCSDFGQTVNVIAKIAFDMFLGVEASSHPHPSDENCFYITLKQNPFLQYVSLPPGYSDLIYCNALCGVIAGALRTLQLVVQCEFVEQRIIGQAADKIQIKLISILHEGYIEEEQ